MSSPGFGPVAPPLPSVTIIVAPSGVNATPVGYQPVGIEPSTSIVVASSTVTALLAARVTYSRSVEGSYHSALGLELRAGSVSPGSVMSPTHACPTTARVAVLMAITWSPPETAAHRRVPSGSAASPSGLLVAVTGSSAFPSARSMTLILSDANTDANSRSWPGTLSTSHTPSGSTIVRRSVIVAVSSSTMPLPAVLP